MLRLTKFQFKVIQWKLTLTFMVKYLLSSLSPSPSPCPNKAPPSTTITKEKKIQSISWAYTRTMRRSELSSVCWWKKITIGEEDKIFLITSLTQYQLISFSGILLWSSNYFWKRKVTDQTLNGFNCSWNYALEK